jgi:hypothetical protein
MKRSLLLLFWALGFSGCVTNEVKAASRTVCAGLQNVPAGWVVFGRTREQVCGTGDMNAWLIKQPGPKEQVCRFSPRPSGYSIVGVIHLQSCSDAIDNAYIIER